MKVFVGLGSNLGDRVATLRAGLEALGSGWAPSTVLVAHSSLYRTRPVGPATGTFVNAVAELQSELSPLELLDALLRLEQEHGRVRRERWGDRTLDLDLLCAFDEKGRALRLAHPRLELPHPQMLKRDFVLTPLAELAPELEITGKKVRDWLRELPADALTLEDRIAEGPKR